MNAMLLGFGCVLFGLTVTLSAPIGQNEEFRRRGRGPRTKDEVKVRR